MAVLVEDLCLIVRVSTLMEKYPGGLAGFLQDSYEEGFCSDGLLARVGSPAREDVEHYIRRFLEHGFVLSDEAGFRDMGIVDERRGMPDKCSWLESTWRANGLRLASAIGSDSEGMIAVPKGWDTEVEGDARARPGAGRPLGEDAVHQDRR
jgi:hypothetical protein